MPQSVWNKRFPAHDLYLQGRESIHFVPKQSRDSCRTREIQWTAAELFSISLGSPKLSHHFLLSSIFIPVISNLTRPFLQLQTYNQWKMPWFSLLIFNLIPCLLLFPPKPRICCSTWFCVCGFVLSVLLHCPTHPHHLQYLCFYPVVEIFYKIPFCPEIVPLNKEKK